MIYWRKWEWAFILTFHLNRWQDFLDVKWREVELAYLLLWLLALCCFCFMKSFFRDEVLVLEQALVPRSWIRGIECFTQDKAAFHSSRFLCKCKKVKPFCGRRVYVQDMFDFIRPLTLSSSSTLERKTIKGCKKIKPHCESCHGIQEI